MTLERTGVVGAGLMGQDIAGLLANAGYQVTLVDIDSDALEDARSMHERELVEELRKGGFEVADDPTARIRYDTALAGLDDADFVVEAIPETLEGKQQLLQDLETVLPDRAVIGTNTSSLTPGEIAAKMDRPERVVLFHFANPALLRDLVEISGDEAADYALETATTVARAIERHPIRLQAEYRANGLSRLSASIKCAASWERLEASAASIDRGARAVGFDRGPFELIDLIGLDVHLATVDNLGAVYGKRYAPPSEVRESMEAMIDRGQLGKKSGHGFFEWDDSTCQLPAVENSHDVTPILAALVNEGHRLVDDGIADAATVDEILKRGGDSEVGPFDLEELFGTEYLRGVLDSRFEETGGRIYEPIF